MSTPKKRIYVAGHRGLVGSAIVRRIAETANQSREDILGEVGDYAESLMRALQGCRVRPDTGRSGS